MVHAFILAEAKGCWLLGSAPANRCTGTKKCIRTIFASSPAHRPSRHLYSRRGDRRGRELVGNVPVYVDRTVHVVWYAIECPPALYLPSKPIGQVWHVRPERVGLQRDAAPFQHVRALLLSGHRCKVAYCL
jgi:hypothetical protein